MTKPTKPRTLRLTLEYDGAPYVGWQRQENLPSVQACVEDAILRIFGIEVRLSVAGRTDAGVHARGQVCSFVLPNHPLEARRIPAALNAALPESIAVHLAEEMPEGFVARGQSIGKTYAYRILEAPQRAPLEHRSAWHLRGPLDVDAMRQAAAMLIGEHDFESFRSAHCDAAHAIRRISAITLHARPREFGQSRLIDITIEGNAFCRHMCRIIAGTLAKVGRGQCNPNAMAQILAAKDRRAAGPTAPALGLTLLEVRYPDQT